MRKSELQCCELCPRRCRVNRLAGETGYCKAGDEVGVYTFFPHHGEEPPISGSRGSGAVFFSRCTMSCIYCQNYPWSQKGSGKSYDVSGLAGIFRKLKEDSCHNWNLVSPTPWLPWIIDALDLAGRDGERLPVVYNSSGYERVETLRALDGMIDVYLVDLRYAADVSAAAASGASDYVRHSRAAIAEMWRQTGPIRTDREGVAVSGMICRLLILPGLAGEARENLRWLAETFGTSVCLSVMAQYTPAYKAADLPPWDRPVTESEHEEVRDEVERLGFENGWVQDFGIPDNNTLLGYNMNPVSGQDEDRIKTQLRSER